MPIRIVEVHENTEDFTALLQTAEQLHQAKYLTVQHIYYDESYLLGAFLDDDCIGFLRFVLQVIGSEEGRPPILFEGNPLREGFVEAFGVLPEYRRQGIGQQLQEPAIDFCKTRGCYQIRSRSPITSVENYALKIKMGYAIHPSNENDSYYFIKILKAL